MATLKKATDKVRASRDGHEYHEAWAARKAMQLLWPDSNLFAIAIEGPSPTDQEISSAETVDISDITLYFGKFPTFERAALTTIAQLKYSVADSDTDFRVSHAKKTISKFATAFLDLRSRYGVQAVRDKLDFEIVTNRPIYAPFRNAIDALAIGVICVGEEKKQTDQFKVASGLKGASLKEFASKCKMIGLSGDLPAKWNDLTGVIVNWTGANDLRAVARLERLKKMVRDKAGTAGTRKNLIKRADVLEALGVSDPEDLLPCPSTLAYVGDVVEREQLGDVLTLLPLCSKPLLIHAASGVGKTVFMDSLAAAVDEESEIVFFDCFGGGAYRSPEDARHLPKKGLVHIANTLAFRGLCDPILPDNSDVEALLVTFRRRLLQCVEALKMSTSGRPLVLFIDAIDNAELFACERSEKSFPILLLESLHHDPIPGAKLVVSCRTERRPNTFARCHEIELQPFSAEETAVYLRSRVKKVTEAEISVAQARSGGNPRVLEYLVKSGRGLFDESEVEKEVELGDLIQLRINDALAAATEHGYTQENLGAFLAGLAVLPPPVPLDEYAGAHGMEKSAIESFAVDLRPLLERTGQGLIFRDEPTETFVRSQYASSNKTLKLVAKNLLARQDVSVYAARALPNLLHLLNDGKKLFELAFDDRLPKSIKSTVGKRNIRYARLKAAIRHAAINEDCNRLLRLIVELSTIAAGDQRGAEYILDFPDLVVVANDVDATRRLFETRTRWPGARHARLTIANTLSGDLDEAYRHAVTTHDWIDHYSRSDDEDKRHEAAPERLDIAAIPFLLVTQGRVEQAVQMLEGWREWYVFEVCEYLTRYFHLAQNLGTQLDRKLGKFARAGNSIGLLTASLSFQDLSRVWKKDCISRLTKLCKKATKLHLSDPGYQNDRVYRLQDGLRKASAIALALGLTNEALSISLRAPHRRPDIWSFRDHFYHRDVFSCIFRSAIVAAANKKTVHEKDILPDALFPISKPIRRSLTGNRFREAVKKRLLKCTQSVGREEEKTERKTALSFEEIRYAHDFLDNRMQPLLNLTNALSTVLSASARGVDRAFKEFVTVWDDARKKRDAFRSGEIDQFFHMLGLDAALFLVWARSELKEGSIEHFLSILHSHFATAHTLIQIVAILARRESLHTLAGGQAVKARAIIEKEDDVTHRASLLAMLGRAMLPASTAEAAAYFGAGLEQMDAIGSGDYEFLNELLLFASTMKGNDLDQRDFHTLTNICELNLGGEPEKFFWGAFAKGLSKAAGPRILAKISRWDDRSKVSLESTMLPCLTALVEDEKIDVDIALVFCTN